MNEQILKLAVEARHWAHFDGLAQNPKSSSDVLFEQKFAELIVKKCAAIASNTNLEDVDGGDSAVLGAAREQILEQFGVE